MVHDTITLEGHLIDSDIMRRVFDRVVEEGGEFEVQEFRVGRTNDEPSFARVEIRTADPHALDRILEAVRYLGATTEVGDCAFAPAEADGILPDAFYSSTNFDTLVRIDGRWVEARDQKMDSALVLRGGVPVLRQAGAGEAGRAGGAARHRASACGPSSAAATTRSSASCRTTSPPRSTRASSSGRRRRR